VTISAEKLRASVVAGCQALAERGLTAGTSGNVSVRNGKDGFFVSPSGLDYAHMMPPDVPFVTLDGTWYGLKRPSTEWRFHRDIYKVREDAEAVVHTHSRYATALACRREGVPAFHYMVAIAGGNDIRCAPYATFGTQELSDMALQALDGRSACLLANHGVIALGSSVEKALRLAEEVENLAAQYVISLGQGAPILLDDDEMQRVLNKFQTYGSQEAAAEGLSFGGENIPNSHT